MYWSGAEAEAGAPLPSLSNTETETKTLETRICERVAIAIDLQYTRSFRFVSCLSSVVPHVPVPVFVLVEEVAGGKT